MEVGLVLQILKVALDVFKDERQDRFLKQYKKLEKEWLDETSLPDDERSDLNLDRLRFEAESLTKLIVAEYSNTKH